MKNLSRSFVLLTICSLCFMSNSFAQDTIRVDISAKISISQKFGATIDKGDYTLTIALSETVLSYNTQKGQPMVDCAIKKQTENYIIAETSGNYHFYDKKNKRLYSMDYFMSRYMVSGYGADYSEVKSESEIMMKMLKEGKTQKDVIQHLIKQTEYDY